MFVILLWRIKNVIMTISFFKVRKKKTVVLIIKNLPVKMINKKWFC